MVTGYLISSRDRVAPLVDLWASAGGAGLWLTNELDRTLVFAGASSDGSGIVNVRDDKGAPDGIHWHFPGRKRPGKHQQHRSERSREYFC